MSKDTSQVLLSSLLAKFLIGYISGVDNALVACTDALRKKWTNSCFPEGVESPPFPTFMGDRLTLPRELIPSVAHVSPDGGEKDPFSRTLRERD